MSVSDHSARKEKIKIPSLENRKSTTLAELCPPDFSLFKSYCRDSRAGHMDPGVF